MPQKRVSKDSQPRRRPLPVAGQAARLEHLEALLNSTLDGILVIDEDQKIVLFNRAAEELFRCPASEALGSPLDRFMSAGVRAKHRALVEQYGRSAATSRTMKTPALSLTCLRTDGTEFIGEISISRHMHEGMATYAAIIRDITARTETERQYRESEMQWRSLFENMLDAVARGRVEYADGQPVDWEYLEVNPAFERLTGLSNVVGKKVSELIPGFVESNREMLAQFGEVIASGVPQVMESFVPGLESWFKISAYRPRPEEFIAVFDNITERKTAEDLIRRLNAELEERVHQRTTELEAANRELESFSYSVSHDLRAPLRALDGFSRILLEEHAAHLAPEARRYLELVRSNTQHMGHLVDDLLALSRLGRQSISRQTVLPAEIARQALQELAPEQEGRELEIVIGDLPACRADPSLLRQVYVNLLANALKFTRSRAKARIEVGWASADGAGAYFVRDNGVGFDMQYVDKLFGVFQRLHRAEEYEGTGVGLAIVQRVVIRHGGRAWAEAELEHGATFYFTLPDGRS